MLQIVQQSIRFRFDLRLRQRMDGKLNLESDELLRKRCEQAIPKLAQFSA